MTSVMKADGQIIWIPDPEDYADMPAADDDQTTDREEQ